MSSPVKPIRSRPYRLTKFENHELLALKSLIPRLCASSSAWFHVWGIQGLGWLSSRWPHACAPAQVPGLGVGHGVWAHSQIQRSHLNIWAQAAPWPASQSSKPVAASSDWTSGMSLPIY